MTIKTELILFIVSILSSATGAMIFAWKIGNSTAAMRAELREEVAGMRAALRDQITATDFDRKLNDERLENLQNIQQLGFKGFEERFNHFSERAKREIEKIGDRLNDVEGYLTKKTEFQKR